MESVIILLRVWVVLWLVPDAFVMARHKQRMVIQLIQLNGSEKRNLPSYYL